MLGYYFAERIAGDAGPSSVLSTFLKWEQLAAYCRAYVNRDVTFRGTERVQDTLSNGTRVALSSAKKYQILSDQQTYGLWGLYSVPSASSGLVEQDPARLSSAALEFVESTYLPIFRDAGLPNADRVVAVLSREEATVDLSKGDRTLCEAVARILKQRMLQKERAFYRFHLVDGGPLDATHGRQKLLADIMKRRIAPGDSLTPGLVRAFAKDAKTHGPEGETLAHYLARIAVCDSVLAAATRLFAFVQGMDGKSLDVISSRVREAWGAGVKTISPLDVLGLRAEFATVREDSADRWMAVADNLARGDYAEAVRLVVEQNQATMAARGGAQWVDVRSGRLHVRVRDEQGDLPSSAALADLLRFPYFLNSLLVVTHELRGGSDD